MMMYSRERMKEIVEMLKSSLECNDRGKEHDAISLANRLYGSKIYEISDCVEEVMTFSNTIERNVKNVIYILEEYLDKHSYFTILSSEINTNDVQLNDLVTESILLYNQNEKAIAVEKIWDALERLKTYFSPTLDKRRSVEKIVTLMSNGSEDFRKMFNDEFKSLTDIGNDFRIRHHETNKIDITDDREYDYFYKRCISLISVAVLYLREEDE